MTPSLKAAGSGQMVLLSDTSTGTQVHSKPNTFCMISVRMHSETIYITAELPSLLHLFSQVTQTTITVKTACLYLLTVATGTTTTVSRTKDTSANAEVSYVALIFDPLKQRTFNYQCSVDACW